jgi:hypothetical protein
MVAQHSTDAEQNQILCPPPVAFFMEQSRFVFVTYYDRNKIGYEGRNGNPKKKNNVCHNPLKKKQNY